MMAPVEELQRVCPDCGRAFVIDPEEVAFLEDLAQKNFWSTLHLPKRCTACRSERRRANETVAAEGGPVTLRCVICNTDFTFGSRDRAFYASRAWRYPRRCSACRARG